MHALHTVPHHAWGAVPREGLGGKLWQKRLLEVLDLCLALKGWAESPLPGLSGREQERGHREKKASCFSLWCHHSGSDARQANILPGLHFWGRLIFYSWVWTTKWSSFLFLNLIPLQPLRNLGLNCQKITFKSYKLASLKMLKHLWKHSHFIFFAIKS